MFTNNWKFKKWQQEMQDSIYNSDSSLRTYMNLEIYPEDIEIFLNVLTPKIFEIGDRVFFDIDGEQEMIIREGYEKKTLLIDLTQKDKKTGTLQTLQRYFLIIWITHPMKP